MMETVLESWRAEHRDELAVIYDRLGEILSAPDRAITSDEVQEIAGLLGIGPRQCERSETGHTVIFDIIDGKLDISTDRTGHDHQVAQLRDWTRDLDLPARWERFRDVDSHVIHMHMKKLHGERLAELIRKAGFKGMIPWHIDIVETDTLSIHLISGSCDRIDDNLQIADDADERTRTEVIRRAITTIAETGLEWSKLPGTVRRGITITANHSTDPLTIDGDEIRIKVDSLPEVLKQENVYIGRPLHEIVDIDGYRDESMVIRGMSRRNTDSTITFLINRGRAPVRRRIDIPTGP